MEQLTKNQAVATSQEAVQNQNEPQLRDENAHNDKSVHGVLNPTYQAGLRRDAVQPDIEAELKPPLPALTVKLSKYNVDDVALGVCKTGAEEAGVTEVRTSLSEKKFELWREIKV